MRESAAWDVGIGDEHWLIPFLESVRDKLVPLMKEAGAMASIVSKHGFDGKFAVELGVGIMLDAKIIVLLEKGAVLPPKLNAVAERVIPFDRKDMADLSKKVVAALEELQ